MDKQIEMFYRTGEEDIFCGPEEVAEFLGLEAKTKEGDDCCLQHLQDAGYKILCQSN